MKTRTGISLGVVFALAVLVTAALWWRSALEAERLRAARPAEYLIDLAIQRSADLTAVSDRTARLLSRFQGLPGSLTDFTGPKPSFMRTGSAAPATLSRTVLLADGSVSLSSVDHSVVIATGHVQIQRASAVLVVALQSVGARWILPNEDRSVLVAGTNIEVGPASYENVAVYAPLGVTVLPGDSNTTATNMLAFNTAVSSRDRRFLAYSVGYRDIEGQLYYLEAPRTVARPQDPRADTVFVSKLPASGERCEPGRPLQSMPQGLERQVKDQARCLDIDSAVVACEERASGAAAYRERWELALCGRRATVLHMQDGLDVKWRIDVSPSSAASRAGAMS